MRVTTPVPVRLPPTGLRFAESAHARGFRMEERVEPFHKVLYVLSGRAELRLSGRPALVGVPGTVFLVPAGAAHALTDVEPATILLLCFSPRWLEAVPELPRLWPATLARSGGRLTLSGARRARLEALWRRALFEQVRAAPAAGAVVLAGAAEILAQLARADTPRPTDAPAGRIRAVVAELAGSFVDPWRLDDAARRAGLSRRSFTAHFRAETDETFGEHLERLRVDHAARLLRDGEHTILGAMFSAGFNDLSTFYRAFRRRRGVTPKSWMDRHRSG